MSNITTAMHRERPRHIAAADIKHIASQASNRGRARPTYGRAQNRPRPQQEAAKRHSPRAGDIAQMKPLGGGLPQARFAAPAPLPPLAGGGYPSHITATRATMGAPTWSARLPPTLANAVERPASQQKKTQTRRGKESTGRVTYRSQTAHCLKKRPTKGLDEMIGN
ncbi:Hypothetical predicted protein [Pelobates cultripes]|uniref:Uncharacterized protein n=1 Tax=Pelobates cultripes TaxID=61616 RepID=A0AAD1WRP7_PELCU|nr:Hypothetical predicted protein [Pelobates cultripes]